MAVFRENTFGYPEISKFFSGFGLKKCYGIEPELWEREL